MFFPIHVLKIVKMTYSFSEWGTGKSSVVFTLLLLLLILNDIHHMRYVGLLGLDLAATGADKGPGAATVL